MMYLAFFLLFSITSFAMEPVEAPNQYQSRSVPSQISVMNDTLDIEKNDSKLFDGTRRFYDKATQIQAKRKAYKDCIKFTSIQAAFSTGFCCSFIFAVNILAYLLADDISSFPVQKILTLSGGESSIFLAISLIYFSIAEWLKNVQPIVKNNQPFEEHVYACWPIPQFSLTQPGTIIPESMIDAAENEKLLHIKKTNLLHLYTRTADIFDTLYFDRLRRILYSKNDYELFERTKKRLERLSLSLGEEYHHEEQYCSISEKDALLLLKKRGFLNWERIQTQQFKPYVAASILAENGWIAFAPSPKYPIRCDMRYFDREAISEEMKYYFTEMEASPTIYLPYSPELAKYYKFEDDPVYAFDAITQTNREPERLLPSLTHSIQNSNNEG